MKISKPMMVIIYLLCSTHAWANIDNVQPIKRIALITGSNDGGIHRTPLRYAESDAISVAKVLEELGGLNQTDRTLLLNPTTNQLEQALTSLKKQVQQEHHAINNLELIFYYSGHSDQKGLLLKDGQFTYQRLHQALKSINSGVRVAILDSCESGAFTRLKGGKTIPPFLIDQSSDVKGHVYLTSSAQDEVAQESDAIGASYFTHFLVSALRGSADTNQDGRITLHEAYQRVFNETLSNTENSRGGAQHPAYNIQLSGAGNLVLTDLQKTPASLIIPADVTGRVYIRDNADRLIVEFNKITKQPARIGLNPRQYRVLIDDDGQYYQTNIKLLSNQPLILDKSTLRQVAALESRSRGSTPFAVDSPFKRLFVDSDRRLNTIKLGAYQQRLGFTNHHPEVDHVNYRGISITYARQLVANFNLSTRVYYAKNKGSIKGISADLTFTVLTLQFSTEISTKWYFGAGQFRESLSNYSSFPEGSTRIAKHIGSQISTGIEVLTKGKLLSLDYIRRKSSFNHNEIRTTDIGGVWVMSIGTIF